MAQSSQHHLDQSKSVPQLDNREDIPLTRPYARQPFRRQSSIVGTPTSPPPPLAEDIGPGNDYQDEGFESTPGLGLTNVPLSPNSVKRVPVGAKKSWETFKTRSSSPLSPESPYSLLSQATTVQNTPQRGRNPVGLALSPSEPRSASSSAETNSLKVASDASSVNTTNKAGLLCPTEGDILNGRWSWLAIIVTTLALYSTVFSGLVLGIAFKKPRWGQKIGTQSHMSFAIATLLSALVSKTIELSFVTVFVAFLGQILSRRAIGISKSGISIAEMTMRSWIMQPGTLLTHWTAVRYSVTSIVGVLAVIAAVAATFYTTAVEALVAPKLKFGPVEDKILTGKVSTVFANAKYLADNCETPVSPLHDEEYRGTTCLQIEHAGQAFYNFNSYLTTWGDIDASGNATTSTSDLASRPRPFAMLYENTTVYGEWITPSHENITADSLSHQRLIQNITMVMPHANVPQAARYHMNHILQPDDLQGYGEYWVNASVPVLAINVLCAGLSRNELEPLIHEDGKGPVRAENTVVDDVFHFSEKYGDLQQPTPYFAKPPLPYNTIVNITQKYGPNAVYLLATPPATTLTNDHLLCSVKASQYSNCTTSYHAAESGGELSVHCDQDPANTHPYLKSYPEAPLAVPNKDWKDVGTEWIKAIALSQGISDANASIARLVTQMIPAFDTTTHLATLDTSLPSIGEALGVLAGCTLLMSSTNAPFVHYWNYSTDFTSLKIPAYQHFNASVSYKDYASGSNRRWQGIFYVVLLAVFFLNLFSFGYLFLRFSRDGQITDYTEPANLFALAINSPPSVSLAGTCGAGPDGKVLGKKWQVDMETKNMQGQDVFNTSGSTSGMKHPHFYIRFPDDDSRSRMNTLDHGKMKRKKRSRPGSMQALLSDESPAIGQYKRLSGMRS